MITRYRFVKDDDGHTYLIDERDRDNFNRWLEAGPYWEDYDGKDFSESTIGTHVSNFTFTDPKEDE